MLKKKQRTIFVFVGCVVNSDDKVLLVNRREKQLLEADGKWELPGGKLDFGETIQQAVEREVFEETGYKVKAADIFPRPFYALWHYPSFDQHTVVFCVKCKLITAKRFRKSDHHVNRLGWFRKEEIEKLDLLPGVEFFLQQLKT